MYKQSAGIRYMPHCILSSSVFLIQTKIFSSHFPERTRITIPYKNLQIIPRIAEARITILQHNDNIKTIFVKTKYRPIRFMLRYTLQFLLKYILIMEGFCMWTISARGYRSPCSQCFSTDMVYYISTFLLLPLGQYLCWWTNSPRGYHLPFSQRFLIDIRIKFVSDLRHVGDILRVLRFPPPIKLTATI